MWFEYFETACHTLGKSLLLILLITVLAAWTLACTPNDDAPEPINTGDDFSDDDAASPGGDDGNESDCVEDDPAETWRDSVETPNPANAEVNVRRLQTSDHDVRRRPAGPHSRRQPCRRRVRHDRRGLRGLRG
ncbi:MAG: hypothetical protein M5R36_17425 [Deltaproteobacteria bacterium]|nr:hypothetical protein [Deltaproteobacteria bacterium]